MIILMIKVKNYTQGTQIDSKFSFVFDQSARVLNIVSNLMSDNCTPYRESTGCIAWLAEGGAIGEIECICPVTIDTLDSFLLKQFAIIPNILTVDVYFEEKNVGLYMEKEQMILFLNGNKLPNKKCSYGGLAFYIAADDEVVAIESMTASVQ